MEQELKMAKLAACKAGLAYVELLAIFDANSLTRQQFDPVGSETGRDVEVHYSEADGSLSSKTEDVGDFTKRTMNVAFAGKPAQCIVSHLQCCPDVTPDSGILQEKDGTCAAMYSTFNFTERMGPAEQNQHKYIFDMGMSEPLVGPILETNLVTPDGNGWSGRFHQLMTTNSAILKSTVSWTYQVSDRETDCSAFQAMPEWYSKRIMPWVQ